MKKQLIKPNQKAIWNYSRNHYASDKDKERDGMVVEVLEIYNNGYCSIQFSGKEFIFDVITSAMISELTPLKGA